MTNGSLLYKRSVSVTNKITLNIPTVGEVIDREDDYYSLVLLFTSMPIDLMVQLDDVGIDFTKIDDYELFIILFSGMKGVDASLLFGDMDMSKFELATSENTGDIVLINTEDDIVIDRGVYCEIANLLRKINHLEKNNKKPANEDAKKFMIARARKKLKRKKKQRESMLDDLIISMVNTEQYKYNYEQTRDISIYQFNESVNQIIQKIDYDNRMIGIYTGNIDAKEMSQDQLNWLTHK
jgi:hypothetical protein